MTEKFPHCYIAEAPEGLIRAGIRRPGSDAHPPKIYPALDSGIFMKRW